MERPRTVSSDEPGSATMRLPLQPSSKMLSVVSFCPLAISAERTFLPTSADWRCVGAIASDVLPGLKIIVCAMAIAAAVDLPDCRKVSTHWRLPRGRHHQLPLPSVQVNADLRLQIAIAPD